MTECEFCGTALDSGVGHILVEVAGGAPVACCIPCHRALTVGADGGETDE